MAKGTVAIGVVLTALAGSVGVMWVLTKPQAAPQAKPEAQAVKAITSKPEPKNRGWEQKLNPWQFKVGQWGELYGTHRYYFKIESVLSPDTVQSLCCA